MLVAHLYMGVAGSAGRRERRGVGGRQLMKWYIGEHMCGNEEISVARSVAAGRQAVKSVGPGTKRLLVRIPEPPR